MRGFKRYGVLKNEAPIIIFRKKEAQVLLFLLIISWMNATFMIFMLTDIQLILVLVMILFLLAIYSILHLIRMIRLKINDFVRKIAIHNKNSTKEEKEDQQDFDCDQNQQDLNVHHLIHASVSIKSATNLFIDGKYMQSKLMFSDFLAQPHADTDSDKEAISEDVVIAKYLYSMSCLHLGTYCDLISGYKKLMEITSDHNNDASFPAVHLGAARILQKLNRFARAMDHVELGLRWMDINSSCDTVFYPRISAETIIIETNEHFFREEMERLRIKLKCPPVPDARCRYDQCLTASEGLHIYPSKSIYFTDPDFKPFYKIFCTSKCCVEYHSSCWQKVQKLSRNRSGECSMAIKKQSEKDFLGSACFTPDCYGVIMKIQMLDCNKTKTFEGKNKGQQSGVENKWAQKTRSTVAIRIKKKTREKSSSSSVASLEVVEFEESKYEELESEASAEEKKKKNTIENSAEAEILAKNEELKSCAMQLEQLQRENVKLKLDIQMLKLKSLYKDYEEKKTFLVKKIEKSEQKIHNLSKMTFGRPGTQEYSSVLAVIGELKAFCRTLKDAHCNLQKRYEVRKMLVESEAADFTEVNFYYSFREPNLSVLKSSTSEAFRQGTSSPNILKPSSSYPEATSEMAESEAGQATFTLSANVHGPSPGLLKPSQSNSVDMKKAVQTSDSSEEATQNITGIDHDECSICMESLQDSPDLRTLPCGHLFHIKCVNVCSRIFYLFIFQLTLLTYMAASELAEVRRRSCIRQHLSSVQGVHRGGDINCGRFIF